jgi:Lon-like ATP-dependent protease
VSVATAVISALEDLPVDQEVAMTGSLSVRGEVLPVGGVTAKIEAAAQAGFRRVIIPKANLADVLIEERYRQKIEIVPVETLDEALNASLLAGPKKEGLIAKLAKMIARPATQAAGVLAGAAGTGDKGPPATPGA